MLFLLSNPSLSTGSNLYVDSNVNFNLAFNSLHGMQKNNQLPAK